MIFAFTKKSLQNPLYFSIQKNVVPKVKTGYLVTSSICLFISMDLLLGSRSIFEIWNHSFLLIFLITPQQNLIFPVKGPQQCNSLLQPQESIFLSPIFIQRSTRYLFNYLNTKKSSYDVRDFTPVHLHINILKIKQRHAYICMLNYKKLSLETSLDKRIFFCNITEGSLEFTCRVNIFTIKNVPKILQ